MIKCGWFLTDLAGGGAEKLPLVLAGALEHTELSVILFKNRVQHDVPSEGPRIITLSPGARSLALTGGAVLTRAIRAARRFDVLVAGLEWAPTFFTVTAGAIARRPVVATVHVDLSRYCEYEPVPAIWWRAMRIALSRCAAVVAVSDDARASLAALGVPEQAVHVIPNPSSLPPLERAPRNGRPRIVTVASLRARKGLDIALEAAARLLDLDYEWIVVGEGPDRDSLVVQAERLGLSERVKFVGFQADPRPFYATSDVYVLPSRTEGFPIVLVEAMSAGLPIVATRCGSGVESMIDPTVGELTANGDPGALAEALRTLLLDPVRREGCRQAGQRRARTYQPARIAARYESLLASVVGDPEASATRGAGYGAAGGRRA